MTPLVPAALFGWPLFARWLFTKLEPRRAAIASFLLAWMFLPQYTYEIPIIRYNKVTAACIGILLGMTVPGTARPDRFKFGACDIPILLWCLAPAISSLTNGLGFYDALSGPKLYLMAWVLPYFIGRFFLNNLQSLQDLAMGIFLGGVLYIPFCAMELVISPQLHRIVYGFHGFADFSQSMRGGGYRPTVFMQHGLMVGMWMVSAVLTGMKLYFSGMLPGKFPKLGIDTKWVVLLLLITTILCKSTGALGLMCLGFLIIFLAARLKFSVFVIILILMGPAYMISRGTGYWNGMNFVNAFSHLSVDRAASVLYRFENENILIEKAKQRPIFGWGGWGRSRVYNEEGKDISVTDGFWIIILGQNGLFGIVAFSLLILMPVVNFMHCYPVNTWRNPQVSAVVALPVLLCLFMIDCCLNAMVSPVYMLIAGGLAGQRREGAEPVSSVEEDETEDGLMVPDTPIRTRFL